MDYEKMTIFIENLRAVLGQEHVLTGAATEPYGHDATYLDGTSLAVVKPELTEEVAEVVRLCAAEGIAIVARGAGSSLTGGSVPLAERAIVLSLERMNQIEIDGPNLCAAVGAGAITATIQERAAAEGLMYPPDPASAAICSIGGNVACNAGGMRCLKYGLTADYVLGLTVVLADGTILRLGGRTRKRSSGYRLAQLFVGSEGTLGIVTEAVLKLLPLPRHLATAAVTYDSLDAAAQAIGRLLSSGHLPAALEIMDRPALDLVADLLPPGFDAAADAMVIVEQDGNDPEQVKSDLIRMIEVLGGVDNRIAQSSSEREGLWNARRSFGKVMSARRKNFFAEDVAVPIARVPEMIRRARAAASSAGVDVAIVGHAGDGNLHPNLIFEDDRMDRIGAVASRIFRDAIDLGGTISGEHGLGALKRDHAAVEHGPVALGLMARLKNLLDPQGLLNPHKVLPEMPADEHFLERLPGWGGRIEAGF